MSVAERGQIFGEEIMLVVKWSNKNKVRTELLSIVRDIIKAHNWTQTVAADMLELDQPKISSIENLKTKGFSAERIFMLLSLLDCEVEITVKRNY
ncbi:helix-turn-helix domain-containing protein [Wolbachia endosymbiont of Ctenocephalides felis wCfeT]|uniref:helix-turn-helix domain-containing protein n=1 Tax=Wolbachia endosymbiont of Ctenocephalides felis wCfeT TaxID=2732593 RepID=UPI0014450221|nr:XRE family transcriptional regulator [Wolbachia endosymbiont of Ctenocephalides felis wCfeT]